MENTKLNRREALKAIGCISLCGYLPNVNPLAYILITDDYHSDKYDFLKGKVTRSWHVFWGNYPTAQDSFNQYIESYHWCKDKKVQMVYRTEDFPTPVKHTVELKCPLAPPLTSYDQFHVFRTYELDHYGRIILY